jgi:hypothetical protein
MPRSIVAGLAFGLLVAGCAVDSPTLQSALVMGSTYDTLTCPEVVARYKGAVGREKELAALMEKSGNAVANAFAYNTEYATARANKTYAERAAQRKGCDLADKPPAPPAAAAAPLGAPVAIGPPPPAETKKQ